MTKKELIAILSEEHDISIADAKSYVDTVLRKITLELKRGCSCTLCGFGSFQVKATKERKGRDPSSGQAIIIPANRRIKFTPGTNLLKEVRY